MAGLAYIHNMTDLSTWTSGGSHAKPRFEWTVSEAQSAYRVRIYNDSIKTTLLHDSGKVTSTSTTYDANYAIVLGTEYWWTIEVWDSLDLTSGESSTSAFKVRWGQAIYEYNVGASANWEFSAGSVPANTQRALLFRTATGANGAGASSWVSNISDLTPGTWLNVLVRLATYSAGTDATLTDMTFDYTGSASSPDHWVLTGGVWALDPGNYRYGSRSLRCEINSGEYDADVYPYRFAAGDDIPVIPNTAYVWSAFVRVDPATPLGTGSQIFLAVYEGGSDVDVLAAGFRGQPYGDGAVEIETVDAPEGWKRLILRFTTGESTTLIRPKVVYLRGGFDVGLHRFWLDAVKFEPGTVASPWSPGWVSEAVAIDSYGVAIDGSGGATLRLRHTNGVDEVSLDEIIEAVLGGGGGGGDSIIVAGAGTALTDAVGVDA